ncbi:PREDICTED: ubiquitin carboxyl-terminal hydrolase 8 isoform X3 [Papilio xuthus]|uniref:Ubiquitin carboxyl-terminal hydrolase n=1 Tax=Papilio xuthus TaxID=66420 RepID=A0AAJ6ZJ58_PAPXU|nr:PREDICTED: ubiquitin carboxyl-terminal hydrolase 8 isoform X3 [Papilio xuthus]
MTETRRLQLHLGKCIEDLDKLHNVPDLKSKRAHLLCKTAQKLFEKAEQERDRGDEENSYVYYMKYLRVVAFLSKDKEYMKDKTYYNNMLGTKNPNKAIDAAEMLKNSLIDRYAKEQKAKRLHDIKENELVKQIIDENRKKAIEAIPVHEQPQPVGLPGPDEVTIKSEQLYSILKSGKLKVMILDARPGKDYLESHINYPACISIPEECISPGQSANVLEQNLPSASRAVWSERAAMELIVMLDWSSTAVIPGKTLHLLKTILLKWDIKVQYARQPLALLGGYEDWLLKYPAFTTNHLAVPPSQNSMLDDMLGEIEYPSWSDVVPPSPPAQQAPAPQRAAKPGEPVVDRTSKMAAVQLYEERARNMQLILEEQQRIADTSLTLEMQRIEAEQDWEKVREQREAAQREDLRAMYQLRQQEISSLLMQLENKQFDMEQENQRLREQLEEYQRREREEAERLAESIARAAEQSASDADAQAAMARQEASCAALRELSARRAHIAEVRAARQHLDRRRELLETERKRKLTEARTRRKPQDDDGDTFMEPPEDTVEVPGINRSQSSPNIPKQVSDEEEEETPAPAFDRSTKPHKMAPSSEMQQRDFQPVWGNVGRGLTGLKNLGNTCYMNSIIQCLNNTAILVTYFCNGQYLEHVNRSHSTRGAIAEELAAVVRALWSGQYRFIATKDLRNEVGKHQRAFRGGEQQDSHEFLTILMDWLHLDLQFAIKPPQKEGLPAAERAWHEYTRCKESLVLRLFYGQIRSTVRCVRCAERSATYDSFSNLSLELPAAAARCTLQDCLNLYLKDETIPGWNCPKCKEKRDAVKKLDISRLPPVLVIHFKRFYVDPKEYMSNTYRKKQTYIDFPLEELDMSQFSLHCPGNPMYNLYAVSNHYGSMEGGHYTAYCKSSVYGKWYKYDDHVVTEIPASEVKSSAAYILFYTSCARS